MSVDKFHFVGGENTTDIEHTEAVVLCWKKEAHTIYVMWGGVEHLYIFEGGAQASETFEHWRSQPCEKIVLTLDGVPQAGDRLPVGTEPGSGCDVNVSWNGGYDTDGDHYAGQPDVKHSIYRALMEDPDARDMLDSVFQAAGVSEVVGKGFDPDEA